MKKLAVLLLGLLLTTNAMALECWQEDGDDWYQLKFEDRYMAIVHTDDTDSMELIAYDYAPVYEKNGAKIILTGRYFLVMVPGETYASLYKKVGPKNVLLTDIMSCVEGEEEETYPTIDTWLQDLF